MRSTKALFATTLFMLMLLLVAPQLALASDDDETEADEYDVTARVVRVSLLRGEVTLRHAASKEWERATLNLPLVEGDTVATSADARLEIQIDARNFVRVGADSMLRIVTLREDGIALSLVQGTATLRLARFDRDKEYFEIDAPKTTLAVEQPGLYRLDVGRDGGSVRLTVREGGLARIYSETSGFTLREGRSAELVTSGADEGDWQLSSASSLDEWDNWVIERERYLASRLRYEERERYYGSDIWGAEELDAYGEWVNAGDYGWVWRPAGTVINNYYNWAPYRHGRWRWCPPYGWTWIGDEPWGWAPYHYGRWVYYNNNWCWAPRGQGYRNQRNWWRPALVAIVNVSTSSGEEVAWYPLTYGQHDPYRRNRHRRDGREGRHTPPRSGERDNPRHGNPPHWRDGVTSVPARQFGNEAARFRPASEEIARRATDGEPIRPRQRIAPDDDNQNGPGNRGRGMRPRDMPARPVPVTPPAAIPERETGASTRQPGVALDEALQRTRLYNGRDPRPRSPSTAEPTNNPADRSTGAVERPQRPVARPPLERGGDDDRNFRNNAPSPGRHARPARPEPPAERPPNSTNETVAPAPLESSPVSAPRAEAPPPAPVETPAQPPSEVTPAPPAETPETIDRPTPPERPAQPERPARVEREEPAARPDRPHERQEAPTPQPEPSRVEPTRPEPRSEAPAPPPEPSAPREEAPPPAREEPAHQAETPASPPSPPPPPPESPPPAAEPPREREAPAERPERPADNDRVRTPLN